MSDTDKQTPNKAAASGATWSDGEKIAYLLVLVENGGSIKAKIAAAPIPPGRSESSCKKMLIRMKEKYQNDMRIIKANKSLDGAADGTGPVPKTPRKRKGMDDEGDGEDSPMKKAGGRKKKGDTTAVKKEEVKEEVKVEVEDWDEEV